MSDLKANIERAIEQCLTWTLEVSDERNGLERELNAEVWPLIEADLLRLQAERDAIAAARDALVIALGNTGAERDALRSELAALTQPQVKANCALGLTVRGMRAEIVAAVEDGQVMRTGTRWTLENLLAIIDAAPPATKERT